jgi:hypothetical protein
MLAKLLKYDIRSVKRFGLPILLAVAAATVLGSAAIGGIIGSTGGAAEGSIALSILLIFLFLAIVAVVLVLALAVAGVQIAVYVDFYRSLVSDEGYLTFTLPVKAWQILLSKLLNALIWSTIVGAAVMASVSVLFTVGVLVDTGELIGFSEIVYVFTSFLDMMDTIPPGAVALLLQMPILSFVMAVNSLLLFFMAIFFGSVLAKKHKLIAAIGCVFGVNMIYNFFVQIFSLFLSLPLSFASDPLLYLNIFLPVCILLLAVLSVVFFKLTEHMMEKKLNLP